MNKQKLSFWEIWNMSFGFLRIQFGFALQGGFMSRLFQTLGASESEIPLLWIAAPLTVQESSLSPCVHSILASSHGRTDLAYSMYLRTSRLNIDDYNNEVEEGCHIMSKAGTWLSIVEEFGGMHIKEDKLSFNPEIPDNWKSYSFKMNFRNHILKVLVRAERTEIILDEGNNLELNLNGKLLKVESKTKVLT